jgi:hypothetical protein
MGAIYIPSNRACIRQRASVLQYLQSITTPISPSVRITTKTRPHLEEPVRLQPIHANPSDSAPLQEAENVTGRAELVCEIEG